MYSAKDIDWEGYTGAGGLTGNGTVSEVAAGGALLCWGEGRYSRETEVALETVDGG